MQTIAGALPEPVDIAWCQRPVGKGQLLVSQPAHLLKAGLASETRFSLLNLVVLDYTPHWFEQAPIPGGLKGATPKMGSLPAACMADLMRRVTLPSSTD